MWRSNYSTTGTLLYEWVSTTFFSKERLILIFNLLMLKAFSIPSNPIRHRFSKIGRL